MSEVCVVGLGPWGLSVLERLVGSARRAPRAQLRVHVVEPGRPGGGIFSLGHPDYMVLNTPCGQHSMYPFAPQPGESRLGTGFYEWALARGYRWQDLEEAPVPGSLSGTELALRGTGGRPGQALAPGDFLPRRLMGEYLEWFFEVLKQEAPDWVEIVHHPAAAVDIEPLDDGRERVHLDNGARLDVDHVAITTGHMQEGTSVQPGHGGQPGSGDQNGSGQSHTEHFLAAYPVEPYMATLTPAHSVAIEGMGLVALDVLTALTVGLGGSYSPGANGRLRYNPSGREPRIYMFSRGGFPYTAKSFGAADPMGDYVPAICTTEAVRALKTGPDGGHRRMDARKELLPLVFAEMELCYFTTAAAQRDGNEVAEAVRAELVAAYTAGRFADARARWAARYGKFSAAAQFFVGEGANYVSAADYQRTVCSYVGADLDAALVQGGASPVKAALETLRALRDTLRYAVEFKGLEYSSHLDFQENLRGRFARLVAGPPAFRNQQLLALMDAGVLSLPFGPSPRLELLPGGRTRICSTRLGEPTQIVVDHVVRAHLQLPAVGRSSSPLLANLARRERVRPLDFEGLPAGSIDLDAEFHPLGSRGDAQRRLWVFGVLSEGVRYFTLYIPSPKSRVRAFVDAQSFADAVVAADALPREDVIVLTGDGGRGARTGNRHGPGARTGNRHGLDAQRARLVKVALVNNMPDSAFVDTEQQWLDLLGAERAPSDGAGPDLSVDFYTLPGVSRSPQVETVIADRYLPLAHLWGNPPDILILTGAEPKTAELTDEAYWPAMERLLWWARSNVAQVVASCLSAHAALWAFDRLPRRLLLDKRSGVYPQEV
ncbi:MAG TPA: homoserine O-succinyltransferase, partial [Acidimicrobiales bacterium]|nr:homoserine O-succinyltransferase [Acidimicrobiales bacterium]